ncbi:hypothetical protein AU198_23085 [Mycobacterium sp. GA-1199]|nr:hypothetical protein AU198_23085 [Mycobacterium sp. GA-1199]
MVVTSGTLASALVTDLFAAASDVPAIGKRCDSRLTLGATISSAPGRTGFADSVRDRALCPLAGSLGSVVGSSAVPVGAICPRDCPSGLRVGLSPLPGVLFPFESSVPATVPVPADCFGGLPFLDALSFLVFGEAKPPTLVPFCEADFDFPALAEVCFPLPVLFAALLSECLLALDSEDACDDVVSSA